MKIKICDCGYKGNFFGKKCNGCRARQSWQKKRNKPKKFPKPKTKSTGQAELFLQLWQERPHVSFVSRKPLGDVPVVDFFFHVLPKGGYKKAMLIPENIIFTTAEEHHEWHSMGREDLLKKNPNWQKVFDLYEQLKIAYNNGTLLLHDD